jgi:hypothetical protein
LALSVLLIGLGSIGALAPGALAGSKSKPKPKPKQVALLPDRSCHGLLGVAAFPNSTGEGPTGGRKSAEDDFTSCIFEAQEPTEMEPHPKGGGGDTLHVFDRVAYNHIEHGGMKTLLTLFPLPPGSNYMTVLHGIGTRGYWAATDNGGSFGVVQVRNDVFTVLKEGVGATGPLALVASELCHKCK